jgi:hypothetical protein
MVEGASLITHRLESGARAQLPRVDAHCVYVLANKRGELRSFPYTPGFSDRIGSVRCYVVDMSRHASSGQLRIPAAGDVYYFDAAYDVQWQVADPTEVVRGNVEQGGPCVTGFLTHHLWPIGRQFGADDAGNAEARIAATLGAEALARGLLIGYGLVVTGLAVRLTPDSRVTHRGVDLDDDTHQGTLTVRRKQRLEQLLDGDGSAILLHLAQNPNDTGTVLQMITEARDKNEQLRLQWLDRMRQDDAIHEADYEQARAAVLGPTAGTPPALAMGKVTSAWPGSLPPAGPARTPEIPAQSTCGSAAPFAPPAPFLSPPPATDPRGSPVIEPFAPPAPVAGPDQAGAGPVKPFATPMVIIRWAGTADVEYRVRCLMEGERWRVVARTTSTVIEDAGAPLGELPTYTVSSAVNGARSAEVRSEP